MIKVRYIKKDQNCSRLFSVPIKKENNLVSMSYVKQERRDLPRKARSRVFHLDVRDMSCARAIRYPKEDGWTKTCMRIDRTLATGTCSLRVVTMTSFVSSHKSSTTRASHTHAFATYLVFASTSLLV